MTPNNNFYSQIRNVDHYNNQLISEYHRSMGDGIKANDIDAMITMNQNTNYNSPSLILNEFKKGKTPIALIEYKHFNIRDIYYYELEPNINLANLAGLPYFLILYWLTGDPKTQVGRSPLLHNQFYIKSYNKNGSDILLDNKQFLKLNGELSADEGFMSEHQFHQLHYFLRKEPYDKNLSDIVDETRPLPQFNY